MRPSFSLDAGDAVCNLDFKTTHLELDDGENEDLVTVDCNMHYRADLDTGTTNCRYRPVARP